MGLLHQVLSLIIIIIISNNINIDMITSTITITMTITSNITISITITSMYCYHYVLLTIIYYTGLLHQAIWYAMIKMVKLKEVTKHNMSIYDIL